MFLNPSCFKICTHFATCNTNSFTSLADAGRRQGSQRAGQTPWHERHESEQPDLGVSVPSSADHRGGSSLHHCCPGHGREHVPHAAHRFQEAAKTV